MKSSDWSKRRYANLDSTSCVASRNSKIGKFQFEHCANNSSISQSEAVVLAESARLNNEPGGLTDLKFNSFLIGLC